MTNNPTGANGQATNLIENFAKDVYRELTGLQNNSCEVSMRNVEKVLNLYRLGYAGKQEEQATAALDSLAGAIKARYEKSFGEVVLNSYEEIVDYCLAAAKAELTKEGNGQ